MKKIIDKNLPCKVKMFSYTIGKEEICVELAKHYKTKIIADKGRYMNMRVLDYHPELFTLDPSKGFIYMDKGINSAKNREKIKDGRRLWDV